MLWATLRQLQSKDARTRRQAAEKLGDTKQRRAIKALAAALKDPDSWVRQEAAEALGKIGDARAVEPLVEALTDSEMLACSGFLCYITRVAGEQGEPARERLRLPSDDASCLNSMGRTA